MNALTLKSPAKINLFLEVLKKREDGFHEIETIFQAVTLYDYIKIKKIKKPGIFIKTNCRNLPVDNRNLIYKAVEMLTKKKPLGGIEISLDKRIPLGSGLGGGSSNAASVLLGINKLWKLRLKKAELSEICSQIGCDVQFFLKGYSSALGRGRGEILKPVKVPHFWFLLVMPKFGTSTKEVYTRLQLDLTEKVKNAKIFLSALKKKDITQIGKKLYNRLESVVLEEYPLMKKIKQTLKTAGYKAVLMSGSGSTIFVLTFTRKEAVEAREQMRPLGCKMEVVSSL